MSEARDPDYDELWNLAGKLSAALDGHPDAGEQRFSDRDIEVLTMVDHRDAPRAS